MSFLMIAINQEAYASEQGDTFSRTILLYKHEIITLIHKYLRDDEAKQVLIEVHKRVWGKHSGGRALAHKF